MGRGNDQEEKKIIRNGREPSSSRSKERSKERLQRKVSPQKG